MAAAISLADATEMTSFAIGFDHLWVATGTTLIAYPLAALGDNAH